MPLPNLANAVLLSAYVDTHGARCLDGTPQRYWLQTAVGINSTKWAIDFEGGAWCEDLASCASRAYGYTCWLGSSRPECLERQAPGDGIPGVVYNDTMDFMDIPSCLGSRWCGGLMNNDPTKNELSYAWNKVMVEYCDGMSYGALNETGQLVFKGFKPSFFLSLFNSSIDLISIRSFLIEAISPL